MSHPLKLVQSLRERGVWLECKLRLVADRGVVSYMERSVVKQLKPLIIRQLAEEMLTDSLRQQLATNPGDSKTKVHMLTCQGIVTRDPTKCFLWTREVLGFGWWYSSQFPPPDR